MLYILYCLLFAYSLPLIAVVAVMVSSDSFTIFNPGVEIVGAFATAFLNVFRDILGSLVVPLVTAYSVPLREVGQSVSTTTKVIFTWFLVLFVVSAVSYSLILVRQSAILAQGSYLFEPLRDLTLIHAKEALAYIALTIGISEKRK